VRSRYEELSFDPQEQDDIEERLDIINRLKKKYGGSIEEILLFEQKARKELSEIESSEQTIAALRKRLDIATNAAKECSKVLSQARLKSASVFVQAVRDELINLDMPNVIFEISHQETELSPSGADSLEFMISVTPWGIPKPLAKIASGGELSRIMLSIKNVISAKDDIPTRDIRRD
jgi:DNA repair protein RecN (Recombination protein N)